LIPISSQLIVKYCLKEIGINFPQRIKGLKGVLENSLETLCKPDLLLPFRALLTIHNLTSSGFLKTEDHSGHSCLSTTTLPCQCKNFRSFYLKGDLINGKDFLP